MKLRNGDFAKDFTTRDIYGNRVQLKSFQGKKLLLSFYRNVVCPFCNFRVYQLSKYYSEYKDELEMIFVFESEGKKMLQSSFHSSIAPIPMIGDAERKLYMQYGVEKITPDALKLGLSPGLKIQLEEIKKEKAIQVTVEEKNSDIIPADFLIDENFKIIEAYYGKDVADYIPLETVLAFAKPA